MLFVAFAYAGQTFNAPAEAGAEGQVLARAAVAGTTEWITITNTITVGTTVFSGGTTGSILFIGASEVVQQDSALVWNNSTKRFGLGGPPSMGRAHFQGNGFSGNGLVMEDMTGGTTGVFYCDSLSYYIGTTTAHPIVFFTNNGVGKVTIGPTGLGSNVSIDNQHASDIALLVTGKVSQTATLTRLRGISSTNSIREQADIDTAWIDNTDATRKSRLILKAWDTAAREVARGWGDGASGRIAVAAPASAPTDEHLANGQISFYVDEVGNNLLVRVKYSDGTLKLATIALS